MVATYPYARKNKRKARNALGSLWHKIANQSEHSIFMIWTNENAQVCVVLLQWCTGTECTVRSSESNRCDILALSLQFSVFLSRRSVQHYTAIDHDGCRGVYTHTVFYFFFQISFTQRNICHLDCFNCSSPEIVF